MLLEVALMAVVNRILNSLFGWLYRNVECWIWFSNRNMLLRLSVNMNVYVMLFLVCFITRNNGYSLALRMFG